MALSVLFEFLLIFLYICAPSSYVRFSFLLLIDMQFFCLKSFLQWTQKKDFSDPDFRERKLPVGWVGELDVAGTGGSWLAWALCAATIVPQLCSSDTVETRSRSVSTGSRSASCWPFLQSNSPLQRGVQVNSEAQVISHSRVQCSVFHNPLSELSGPLSLLIASPRVPEFLTWYRSRKSGDKHVNGLPRNRAHQPPCGAYSS